MSSSAPRERNPVCAVVLNFRRPWNIAPILEACVESGCFERIYLIDQADPEHRLAGVPEGVEYLKRENAGAGRRVSFAAESAYEHFLAIDDDVLLSPLQIDALVGFGLADPARVHGIWGQTIDFFEGLPRLSGGITGVTREVDVLNRVYFFGRNHARAALSLARAVGFPEWEEIGPTDDILLSMCGRHSPICHDLGSIKDCATSNDDRVAVWRQPGFEKRRLEMLRRLQVLEARMRGEQAAREA